MEITVRGRHFEVTEQLEERARRKLARLGHFLPALEDATVEMDLVHERSRDPGQRFIAHVTVSAHGIHLRAEEHGAQPEVVIDQAAQVLTKQARRQKERLYGRGRSSNQKEPADSEAVEEFDDEESELLHKVRKVKRFSVKPMTTEEALEQMELLGHDFFLFLDDDEKQFAVLYRRKSGDYGLIIPEKS